MERPDDTLTRDFRLHAQACYPNEACGFVIARGKKAFFLPARNVSLSPRDQFVIDHRDYAAAEDAGDGILAIWHSHVDHDNTPSEADLAGCEASELPWLISSVQRRGEAFFHDEPRVIEPSGFSMPYVGRPYVFGTFDCYSLARDYYEREFGIRLDSFHHLRIPNWWEKGMDVVEDHWRSQGFVPVTDGTWKEGDGLTFAIDSNVANHVAVYVTGDIMLHHVINRLSRTETIGPYWSSKIKHHFRHSSRC